jgi:hypothetical protein
MGFGTWAEAAGVAGIAPQDCRRTCAKLCRAAGGELELIQMMLGRFSPNHGAVFGDETGSSLRAERRDQAESGRTLSRARFKRLFAFSGPIELERVSPPQTSDDPQSPSSPESSSE